MIITCPSCSSEYTIDSERIGSVGRKVRCAACRESWFITPSEPQATSYADDGPDIAQGATPAAGANSPPAEATEAAQQDVATAVSPSLPDPIVVDAETTFPKHSSKRRAKGRPRRANQKHPAGSRRTGTELALVASCAVLLALPAAIAFRPAIVRVAPGTAALFSAVGLPVNLVGLTIGSVTSSLSQEQAGQVLVITGSVVNAVGRAVAVPPLSVAIEGERGEALYSWSVDPGTAELPAGQSAPFRVRLASPPPAGKRVEITFREGPRGGQVALR